MYLYNKYLKSFLIFLTLFLSLSVFSQSAIVKGTVVDETGMPLLAKFIAIPPPMVPAPIMATLSILRKGVSFSSPSTFAACRSAKKTCLNATDSGERIHSVNSSRSRFMPLSKDISTAACTAEMIRETLMRKPLSANYATNLTTEGNELKKVIFC